MEYDRLGNHSYVIGSPVQRRSFFESVFLPGKRECETEWPADKRIRMLNKVVSIRAFAGGSVSVT